MKHINSFLILTLILFIGCDNPTSSENSLKVTGTVSTFIGSPSILVPLPEVTIQIAGVDRERWITKTTTDNEGKYEINLSIGNHYMRFLKDGFAEQQRLISVTEDSENKASIILVPNNQFQKINM